MAVHWQVPFKSLHNNTFVVNIHDDDYSGDPVILIGAKSPFETQENDDKDPFAPIRTNSGYIRVINEGNTEGLIPDTNISRYVTLTKNGSVVWQGFLSTQVFSQDWDATPYEIELPVVSPLSLLDTKELDTELGLSSRTIGQLIAEVFTQMRYNSLYMNIHVDDIGEVSKILSWEVSRYNWFVENDAEDDGTGEWKPYVGMTYQQLMEEILSTFGLCLIERGRTLFLKALTMQQTENLGEQKYFVISMSDFIAGRYNETAFVTQPIDFASFEFAGTDHKQDVATGYRKITINAHTNPIKELMGEFNVEGHRVINTNMLYYDKWLNPADAATAYFFSKVRLRENAKITDNFRIHTYRQSSCTDEIDYPSEYGEETWGCVLADFDIYDSDEVRNGKKNFDYDQGILCHTASLIAGDNITPSTPPRLAWGQRVGFELKSKERAYYNNGYLCLSIDSQSMDYYRVDRVNGLGHMILGLRIGNKYWNGQSWQDTSCTFYCKFGAEGASRWDEDGAGKTIDTKTLAMDCNGASGYIIPVNTELSGDVELQFLCSWSYIGGSSAQRGLPRYLCIKNVELKYYSPDTEATSDKTTNTYAKLTGANFSDEKTVELSVASWNLNKKGYGILTYNGGNAQKAKFYINGTKVDARPEEYLLDSMAKFFAHSTKSLTVQITRKENLLPDYRINKDGNIYIISSQSDIWCNDQSDVTLIELPS